VRGGFLGWFEFAILDKEELVQWSLFGSCNYTCKKGKLESCCCGEEMRLLIQNASGGATNGEPEFRKFEYDLDR